MAVEVDPVLAEQLPKTVAELAPEFASKLELVRADALHVDELPGPAPTALVANLPYNVSVPVLLHFLERFDSLQTALVMVQSEVAHRLAAGPGSRTYGVPSLKARWWADVSLAGNIGRSVFWPAPNVDSALVALRRREPPASPELRERTFALVDAAFAQRRNAPLETETPAYTLVNASLEWHPLDERPELTLGLAANNIFDAVARRHSSLLKDYAPLAGRDIRLTASIGF